MARETMQQRDKRTQSKTRTSSNAQSARSSAADRQAPIQTSRDENQPSGQSQPIQSSQHNQQSQQTPSSQSNRYVQQPSSVARRGSISPVRSVASSPFELMQRMSDDMDRLLEQFGFGRVGLGLGPTLGSSLISDFGSTSPLLGGGQSFWAPQVETRQRGDRFVIRADLPGVNKDDVHVEVNDDVLSISGERRSQQEEDRDGVFRSERSYGSFYRAIPLPDGVNADQCEAKFNDGVLEISLPAPKHEQRKSKQIEIR